MLINHQPCALLLFCSSAGAHLHLVHPERGVRAVAGLAGPGAAGGGRQPRAGRGAGQEGGGRPQQAHPASPPEDPGL